MFFRCKRCGKEFEDYLSNNRTFCSRKCFIGIAEKRCLACNVKFKQSYKSQKYCSNMCGVMARVVPPKPCKVCGKEFKKRSGSFLCSVKCRIAWVSKLIERDCPICSKTFKSKQSKDRLYCSRGCYYESRRLIKGLDLINGKVKVKCFECGEPVYRFPCFIKQHKIFHCSTCRPINESSEIKKLRGTKEYARWRSDVFERDGHTCQICYKVDCYLEAHHIIAMSKDITLALVLNNGQALCLDCHGVVHGVVFKREWVEESQHGE